MEDTSENSRGIELKNLTKRSRLLVEEDNTEDKNSLCNSDLEEWENTQTDLSQSSEEDKVTLSAKLMKEATEEQDLINESKKLTKVFVFLNKPWFIILIFGTILSVCLTTIILTYFSGSDSATTLSHHGVVVSEHEICSSIGKSILSNGGNAVDASVATTLCLGVVNPFSSGLGGGGYMIIQSSNFGISDVIDFRETAPAASTPNMFFPLFMKDGEFKVPMKYNITGGLSIAVPGELKGLYMAHSKYGNLAWFDVVSPAATLANGGFYVDSFCAQYFAKYAREVQEYGLNSIFAIDEKEFFSLSGKFVTRPNLAKTLYRIAQEGPDVFYNGEIGKKLINDIKVNGSILTLEDLANYQSISAPPIKGFYHGLGVNTVGLSSVGGLAILEILNILERYNIPKEGITPQTIHLMVESFKHAFSDVSQLGDPQFDFQTDLLVHLFQSKDFSSLVRRKISPFQTFDSSYYGMETLIDKGSSSVVVVDTDRTVVALTSTLNGPFGSWVYSNSTGILLNNQMSSFFIFPLSEQNNTESLGLNLYGKIGNKIEPGKRPLSSISCTILLRDGDLELAVASSGSFSGQTMVTSVIQTILDNLFGFDIEQAVNKKRIHHQLYPNKVFAEKDYPSNLLDALKLLGHEIEELDSSEVLGTIQAVRQREDGWLFAVSDSRKPGKPIGY